MNAQMHTMSHATPFAELTATRGGRSGGRGMRHADVRAEPGAWERSVQYCASAENLDRLLAGQIAGICIPAFLTAQECEGIAKRARSLHFDAYQNVTPSIEHLGITVFEFDQQEGKAGYFGAVEQTFRAVSQVVGASDPLQKVIDVLGGAYRDGEVGIAREPGYGRYFVGQLRRIERGTLVHVDYAPAEQPGWAVGQVRSQLSWNLYLAVPQGDPGVLRVWDRAWVPGDDRLKIPDSYGYRPEIVAGVEHADIVPEAGMLAICNTRYFHQVAPAGGMRLTMSGAAGRTPDGRIVLWS